MQAVPAAEEEEAAEVAPAVRHLPVESCKCKGVPPAAVQEEVVDAAVDPDRVLSSSKEAKDHPAAAAVVMAAVMAAVTAAVMEAFNRFVDLDLVTMVAAAVAQSAAAVAVVVQCAVAAAVAMVVVPSAAAAVVGVVVQSAVAVVAAVVWHSLAKSSWYQLEVMADSLLDVVPGSDLVMVACPSKKSL